jgi:amino acid adenylation domain-containing protein/non-ribosomal peptide synthase protein (TIGR01720 family)
MDNLAVTGFEISPQQKHLWLSSSVEERQKLRVEGTILLEGNLDETVLAKAIQKVINNYEILRTGFKSISDLNIPVQVIYERDNFCLNIYDLTNFNAIKQESDIKAIVDRLTQTEFDLERGIVFYASLIKLNPDKNIIAIAISSFCADAVSFYNIVREISETYQNYLEEKEINNEPLQYADLAAWQNELLTAPEAQVDQQYWQNKKLANLAINKLPTEKPVDSKLAFIPQVINLNISSDLLKQLELLAEQQNTSIATILITCWQILLWRLTDRQEIAVANCFANRNYAELKPVIGLLAKYIPVQIALTEDLNLSKVLTQLEREIDEMQQWQEYFVDIPNNSSLSYAFEFNSQPNKYQNNNLTFTIQNLSTYSDRFNIKLTCWDNNNSLTIQLNYDANLFQEEDIKTLSLEYQALLESVINNPEIAIDRLNILSPQERDRLLIEFNQTESLIPPYQFLHHWFEAQANKTPDATAIIFEGKQLTYQELNNKAENIAKYLISLGVKPETVIALCVERSLDMAIGIIGILKAGAAYLPLEPNLPSEAISFRLKDAQVPIVLTQKHLQTKIETCVSSTQNKIEIISLDNNLQFSFSTPLNLGRKPCAPTAPKPDNLAYIIYTSGSTGKPKGVAVEHRQIVNYLSGALAKLNIPEAASFALVSTFAADLGNTSIFGALCTGGCLHIINESKSTDPIALADYFSCHQIDCLKIVSSHLSALLTDVNAEKLLPHQRLILGGEAPTWELISKVHQLVPDCQIFNHYGPTETTVGVLINRIDPTQQDNSLPLLGNPIANTQIYILDKHQQPVPIGVSGEIYIGGANVARGYINQPELTVETFHKTSLQDENLYKTGDKARYLPNGKIEFLGRIDRQIKLHGYRIELGEIETVLRQHPQVTNAVVTIQEKSNNKYLVAYFIANEEIDGKLSNFLSNKLPEYMLPSHLIQLKAFPLTSNGKIDVNSLSSLENINTESSTFVAPRDRIETALAEIWAKLLGQEKISINDNFFALGGDSIISIQAIAKANQIGLRLTPKQIFEHQTIAQLATVAEVNNSFTSEQSLVTGIVPLTPIQHRFFEQNLAEPHHWNQSILLELKQDITKKQLETAIEYLLKHHDVLRSHFKRESTEWQSAINESIPEIVFSQIDLSNISEKRQISDLETIATKIQSGLDLSAGKLIKILLFDLGKNQNKRLLIVIHHLVIDGVSWRILLEDLQTLLTQISQGETIKLPPKTTSFKQWSEHLQEYAQTESVKAELDYWLSLITPLDKVGRGDRDLSLPVDFVNGENLVGSSATVSVSLDLEETKILLQEIPTVYHTQINNILMAALVKTFSEWTGESQLLIHLEGHGREDIFTDVNLSRTVGWFTNIFPVLLDIKETDSNVEVIKSIKEQLSQVPNKGIGYGLLRYFNQDKTISQALSAIPKAEVCFNYLGQFDNLLADSAWFKLASESDGQPRSPLNKRRYLFNINSYVIDGKLKFDWIYSSQIYREQTVINLANNYIKILQNFIALSYLEVKSYNALDFPQANLNQKQLDQFLATLD